MKCFASCLRCVCLVIASLHAAQAQLRPTPGQIDSITTASSDFCRAALLEDSGPEAVMSGNTRTKLSKIIEGLSVANVGAAAALNSAATMRVLDKAAAHILATSARCEQDLAELLTRDMFPDIDSNDAAATYIPLQTAGLSGHYTGIVSNTTLMTRGSIVLDVSDDDASRTIHLHTQIATINDGDLEITSAGGQTIEASGPMHTSRGVDYTVRFEARRYGGPHDGAMLKGSFYISPVSAAGNRQRYEFEARRLSSVSVP